MRNTMSYKGYFAKIEYQDEDNLFFGTVLGIDDLIVFEGGSSERLKAAFAESIDDYLSMCERNDKVPQKAYSGSFNIRIPVETHQMLERLAASKQTTLNSVVNEALQHYCFG